MVLAESASEAADGKITVNGITSALWSSAVPTQFPASVLVVRFYPDFKSSDQRFKAHLVLVDPSHKETILVGIEFGSEAQEVHATDFFDTVIPLAPIPIQSFGRHRLAIRDRARQYGTVDLEVFLRR